MTIDELIGLLFKGQVNTAPGMGSAANAGGYTSGPASGSYEWPTGAGYTTKNEDGTVGLTLPQYVPGSVPTPRGAAGTQGGAGLDAETLRRLLLQMGAGRK